MTGLIVGEVNVHVQGVNTDVSQIDSEQDKKESTENEE